MKMEEKELALGFGALSQLTRLQIAEHLGQSGVGGLSAGVLARRIACPPSTLSFHLTSMVDAGLLRASRRGREINYALRPVAVRELLLALALLEGSWDPRIVALLETLLPLEIVAEPGLTAAYNVAFICTRNSTRSIMAEAILERVGHGRFRAYSAGTDPAAEPMPDVIERLRVFGHDTTQLRC